MLTAGFTLEKQCQCCETSRPLRPFIY